MDEKRGIEVLTRLRDLLGAGVHPTVREAELTRSEAEWLASTKLIVLGDTKSWVSNRDSIAFEDRYVIAEVTDAAIAHLVSRKTSQPTKEPEQSKVARAFKVGLWDLMKIVLGAAASIFVAWFVWKHHWK